MEGTIRSLKRSFQGQDVVLERLLQEGSLHLLELLGFLRGKIVGAAVVFRRVVQLPSVLTDGANWFRLPWQFVCHIGVPSVLVDSTVPGELVMLHRVSRLRLRVIEGVAHADPFHGLLGTPWTIVGCGSPIASSTVGATSMTWWYWLRISPLALIPFGQEMTAPLVIPP